MKETEVVRKTLRLTPELARQFAALRLPDDRTETETFARLLGSTVSPEGAKEERHGASAFADRPEPPETDLESLHEALCDVSEGVRRLESTLTTLGEVLSTEGATEARRVLSDEVQRFRAVAIEHQAWFDTIETGLQKSYDAVSRAAAGFRELLPSVQTFAADLAGLQGKLTAAHERDHQKAQAQTQKLIEETNSRFRQLAERYEKTLASLVGLPEKLSQDAERMNADLTRYQQLTAETFNEQLHLLKSAHRDELEEFRSETRKTHLKLTWIFGIPTAVLMVILAFLFFGRPMFEKYESDKIVREVLEPSIQKYATNAVVDQKEFLDRLQKSLDVKVHEMVAKQGLNVETAVKEFRKESFDAHKRAGESDAYATKIFDYWKTEKEKNKSLQETNTELAKKLKGEWGFWDGVSENLGWFFSCLIAVAAISGFLGYKSGTR